MEAMMTKMVMMMMMMTKMVMINDDVTKMEGNTMCRRQARIPPTTH